jgi:hypothetical protein
MAISLLKPAELSAIWLSHFRTLAANLGIAIPELFPPSRVSQENPMPIQTIFLAANEAQESAAVDLSHGSVPGATLPL